MAGEHCSCRDKSCPMHPSNHAQGCTPCILKNLRLGEIPSCFFNKVTNDLDKLDSFSMESFAKAVLEKAEQTETGGKKMKKIGMLVAVEIGSVLGKYGRAAEEIDRFGFQVYKYIRPNVSCMSCTAAPARSRRRRPPSCSSPFTASRPSSTSAWWAV